MSNDRIYVGNLSWNADENTMREALSPFGTVVEVKLITDRETGRSRGFGFVTMGSDEEAQAAISALNGTMLDGRPLKLSIAEERKPRSDRGGRW